MFSICMFTFEVWFLIDGPASIDDCIATGFILQIIELEVRTLVEDVDTVALLNVVLSHIVPHHQHVLTVHSPHDRAQSVQTPPAQVQTITQLEPVCTHGSGLDIGLWI